jgi:signal transduction histidine kinase
MDLPEEIVSSLEKLDEAGDIEKIDLLILLASYYIKKDNDLAIRYAECSKKLSEEFGDDARLAKSCLYLGESYFYSNDLLTAIEHFAAAVILFEKTGDTKNLIEALIKIGTSQNTLGDYSRALDSNFNALRLSHNIGDAKNESLALKLIGSSYFYNGENKFALEYLNRAYEISFANNDKREIADIMLAMAGVYIALGDFGKVIEYYTKCKSLFEEANSSIDLARVYHNLGVIFLRMGKIDDAREFAHIALETFIKLDNKPKICKSLIVIGQTHSIKKEYEIALSYYDRAILIGEKYGNKSILETLYCEKSDVSVATGDYKTAYELHVKYYELVKKRLKETSEAKTRYLTVAHKVDTLKRESDALTAKNSELNQMNEQLNLKNNNLNDTLTSLRLHSSEIKRINTINSKLLSILAHDLKNPLWAIKQTTELHSEQALTPHETQEVFKALSSNADATLNMLEQVLHWGNSQIENKKTTDFVDIAFYELVNSKGTDYNLLLESKNNRLENLCGKELTFKADANMLNFIMRNLIMNANKFTTNGVISVSSIDRENHIEIIVSDTGKGINSVQIARLFNWETRQSSDGTAGEKGTGLGLLICCEFVMNHHGKIWVDSEPGKGSSFHFTISKNLTKNSD